MPAIHRRDILRAGLASAALGCGPLFRLARAAEKDDRAGPNAGEGKAMKIHYVEIVTKDVDAACALYSQAYGVTFGKPDKNLGGARTVKLAEGGMLGVRAPMRPDEKPVVRPYVLVKDIKAAVAAAEKAGAEVAVPPMEIPGHGTCAIFLHGGIESGLWQL
jgi:predicted enzyme related to lactoylglutathione lyase